MPDTQGSTRAPAPASGPVIKFNTTPIPAALGWQSRAIWATTAMTSRTLSTIRVAITPIGFLASGIAGAGNTTETGPDAVRMRHVAGAVMHRLAAAALAVIMLAWIVAGALHYFDVLVK